MVAYLVLQLRGGDILYMYRLYADRHSAYEFIENYHGETNSMWWKVMPVHSGCIQVGGSYDIVLNVRWQTSNRVMVVGVYDVGMIPDFVRENVKYYAETLTCE
jgi:hypothetical protein